MKFGILNGPNLNRLGQREPAIYGSQTLADLEQSIIDKAKELGVTVECFQSNHEGDLIEKIHHWAECQFNGFVLNGAAFTHTSIALRDAIASSDLAFVEVHISNVYAREEFRHKSYTAPLAKGIIAGLGLDGYLHALEWLVRHPSSPDLI
ncbi:type II 3-dehydroquinate dehydratase [Cerasicoccus arenae]|uniref:3-dehydroquinate dehydratase n=1 Tax=Cerasicoccus arenae TaxID=424488 RepID=A0A8J3DD67_9BACT|nr:type II 3-dehydroquinate dehydratase [Cerasicoccus arenae]MBK1857078.1 type II 3-dehydroquinate dehydratase [Cerasicoccus arenae]GHB92239.1 3-dehydroquinate dehydratase [Cerasicoccus arenae]